MGRYRWKNLMTNGYFDNFRSPRRVPVVAGENYFYTLKIYQDINQSLLSQTTLIKQQKDYYKQLFLKDTGRFGKNKEELETMRSNYTFLSGRRDVL